ncbi:MAG: glycogen debranching enzyme family protein [Bacteroidetes bacterium]|nr:glycogen debranching enzyme family protein [Bacteroidota bacterium]
MIISLKREELLDLQISLKKEYLLTNGKGGFCSSTIHDCHTRKYHGLLNLPVEGSGKLFNFLSKLELTALINEKEFHLSSNKFPGVYDPTGHKYAESFEYDLFPVTKYKIGEATISKAILMPEGEESVLVKYHLESSEQEISFRAIPLLAYRDIHSLSKQNMDIKPRTYFENNGFKINPYNGLPALFIQSSSPSIFYPSPKWWFNFEYLKERNRGYDYQEDLFVPGVFEFNLKPGEKIVFRASLQPANSDINKEWTKELKRLSFYKKKFDTDKEPLRTIKTHAGQFLVEQNNQMGIIAGYHWFQEWGRDSLISLAGITLCRNDFNSAFKILESFCGYEQNGLLPNMMNETGAHAYNTVDTPLLYFRSVQQFLAYGGDRKKVIKKLLPLMKKIVSAILENKNQLMQLGGDGLIYCGSDSENLTWMDAVVDGNPVTPRSGAPIEINALWYNSIKFLLNDFSQQLDDDLKHQLTDKGEQFERSFEQAFWNEDDACFFDLKNDGNPRASFIRPNQLFAMALPYTCISHEHALKSLETIKQHLLTPYGLRSLSPRNPFYRGEYKGDHKSRDEAYHQGMVWPWLIGIYVDALLKYAKSKAEVKKVVKKQFHELWDIHLKQYGLNHISELFRPNPPYVAKACIAQAWSEAELIRVLSMLKI